jgi:hypothetical protein
MKYIDAHTGAEVPASEVKRMGGQFVRVKTVATKGIREVVIDGAKTFEQYDTEIEMPCGYVKAKD